MNIPKNRRHDLAYRWNCLRLLGSRSFLLRPLFWLSFVLGDRPMFYPSLWSGAKILLCYCVTDTVFAPVWANAAPILHTNFSCPNFQITCYALYEMSTVSASSRTMDHPVCFVDFFQHFWSHHQHPFFYHCGARFGSSYSLV